MKTVIKKIMIGIMCGVMILSGTSCLFDKPSAKEESEYKEKIKQELDKIPIEDSRYKILSLEDGEKLPNDIIAIYPSVRGEKYSGIINLNGVEYKCELINGDREGSDDDYCFIISKEENAKKTFSLNYKEEFNKFGKVSMICIYNNLIFLVRGGVVVTRRFHSMEDIIPRILFVCDYETNSIKYAGYGEDWTSSVSVFKYYEKKQIIKQNVEDKNK